MSNNYYNHAGYPAQSAPGASVDARTEFDSITTGFSLIAPITGYNGRIVRINAGGTAQESVTLATATIESYADAQAGTHSNLTTVAGTNTITATATPTLLAYVTNQSFRFPAAGANTGATTIAIDGLAAKNLVRPDGTALLSGDIPAAGYICDITIRAGDAVLNNAANIAKSVLAATATTSSDSLCSAQALQNVVGSRAFNTVYTNSTGRPMSVYVTANTTGYLVAQLNSTVNAGMSNSNGIYTSLNFIVPNGATYALTAPGGTLTQWYEMR